MIFNKATLNNAKIWELSRWLAVNNNGIIMEEVMLDSRGFDIGHIDNIVIGLDDLNVDNIKLPPLVTLKIVNSNNELYYCEVVGQPIYFVSSKSIPYDRIHGIKFEKLEEALTTEVYPISKWSSKPVQMYIKSRKHS